MRFRRLFFLGGSCDLDAVGVTTSVWFVRSGRTPEGCCLVGQGIYLDEATDTLGGFCRMVRSSVVVIGGSGAGLYASEEDALGVVNSHSTRFKVKILCLCVFGGGVGEMGARRGEVVGLGIAP